MANNKKRQDNDAESVRNEEPESARSNKKPVERRFYKRCLPPSKSEDELNVLEKSFILDCVPLAHISAEYSNCNPKLGPAIPPYNSQEDNLVSNYFSYHGVDDLLHRTSQRIRGQKDFRGTSIAGPVIDRFHKQGAGYIYLSNRNKNGGGHSRHSYDGHGGFMSNAKPMDGFNGRFGYRRNTPWLRNKPSCFGMPFRSSATF